MTRDDALAELIAKVEAGETPTRSEWRTAFQKVTTLDMLMIAADPSDWRAIAAALALHQAVLPGWVWAGANTGAGEGDARPMFLVARVVDGLVDHHDQYEASNNTPARAWLLAILKALHAQEQEMTQ